MISSIKNAALGFCTAAVYLGILSLLAPAGNMKKSVKYAFSLIFLIFCIGIFSIFGKLTKIKTDMPQTAVSCSFSDYYAEYLCAAVMEDNNFSYKKIIANTTESRNNDIYISKLQIITSENAAAVEKAVRQSIEAQKIEVINE